MGNDSGSIAEREMGTFDLQFMPGYRLPLGLLVGMMFDYRFMTQFTEQSEPGATSFAGRGFLWGAAAAFEPGPVKLLLGYDFFARHWISDPDTTFKGSGWRALVAYKFMPGLAFDMQYSDTTYNTRKVRSLEAGLDDDNVGHWNFALGASYSF